MLTAHDRRRNDSRTRRCPTLASERLEPRAAPVSLAPSALHQVLIERINDERQANGLSPWALDTRMQQIAVDSLRLFDEPRHIRQVKSLLSKAKVPWNPKDSITAGLSGTFIGTTTMPSDNAQITSLAEQLASGSPLTDTFGAAKYDRHRMVGLFVAMPDDPRNPYGSLGLTAVSDVTASIKGRIPIVTGVAYQDINANSRYDAGEGLAGVRIEVRGPKLKPVAVQAWDTGGFSLPVKAKRAVTVTVTASGGGLEAPLTQSVQLRPGANTRVSFVVPPPPA